MEPELVSTSTEIPPFHDDRPLSRHITCHIHATAPQATFTPHHHRPHHHRPHSRHITTGHITTGSIHATSPQATSPHWPQHDRPHHERDKNATENNTQSPLLARAERIMMKSQKRRARLQSTKETVIQYTHASNSDSKTRLSKRGLVATSSTVGRKEQSGRECMDCKPNGCFKRKKHSFVHLCTQPVLRSQISFLIRW